MFSNPARIQDLLFDDSIVHGVISRVFGFTKDCEDAL